LTLDLQDDCFLQCRKTALGDLDANEPSCLVLAHPGQNEMNVVVIGVAVDGRQPAQAATAFLLKPGGSGEHELAKVETFGPLGREDHPVDRPPAIVELTVPTPEQLGP
jgi:hypothetical protein